MPAARQAIKMSWVPRGPGKGGTFTNATYHDMVPDSTNILTGGVVKNNAWYPQAKFTGYGSALPGEATSLEIFNRYSGNSQVLSSNVIAGLTNDGAGKSKVYNLGTSDIIRSSLTNQATTGTGRYVFASVKNRLYMANGTDIPVISPDASANSCIPWGFSPQSANLTYQISTPGTGGNVGVLGGTQGTCSITGSSAVVWLSGPTFQYFQINAPIYINGVLCQITAFTDSTHITVTSASAIANGTYAFSYAPAGLFSSTVTYTTASGAFAAWGPIALNQTAGTLTTVTPGNPLYIAVGGVAATITPSVKYTLTSQTGAATGTFTPVEAEAGLAGLARASQLNVSNLTFETGSYQYAVSYFNPTSGHVSNMSPVMVVPNGAPNNAGVSVTISNIICTNDLNYTKIVVWRSQKGGANLFPLVFLNNDTGNFTNNTITYTDFLGDDTALGTATYDGTHGLGKVASPRGENAPPPKDLNYIAYWDGRFWGASQTQIGLLFFSGRSAGNNEDISVGVPEECWQPTFTRVVPESDGRITGLRTVGNNLYVLTDNNIYAVVGGDRDTYGLTRISSKGHGTSHYATCVLPAEDVNSTDVLVHFGNDGRLYMLFGSGGDFAISYPIQDQIISSGSTASTVNVGAIHTKDSSYIYLSLVNRVVFWYDLERKIWSKSWFLTSAFIEGLLNGAVVQAYSAVGPNQVYLGENTTGAPVVGLFVSTNVVSPGPAEARLDDKTLESVRIYTNDANLANVTFYIGGTNMGAMIPVAITSPPYSAYNPFPAVTDSFLLQPVGMARGNIFQFLVGGTPAAFTSAIYEIEANFSYSQTDESKTASL
jgi:hypothetical protein